MQSFACRFFAKEMREHNFMGEQRCPFKSSRPVSISSAQQFVLAVGEFYELGLTELPDQFGAEAQWNQIFQFHTPSV